MDEVHCWSIDDTHLVNFINHVKHLFAHFQHGSHFILLKLSIANNPPLLAFLRSRAEFDRAHLFLILLGNGQVIPATDWQVDIRNAGAPPTTYYAGKYGRWSRGPITSEASFTPNSNTMSLQVTIPAEQTVNFPGTNTPLFQTVSSGLFDKAQVWIYAAYQPINDLVPPPVKGFDTTLGLETKFMGEITSIQSLDRSQCTFDVADLLYRLNQKSPPRLLQAPCSWTLFDAHCTLNAASFQQPGQVASGSTQRIINTTGALPTIGSDALPYTLGVLKFTSGANNGLAGKVKQQISTTQIEIDAPFILPVQVGDQFVVQPGCDLTSTTCDKKFNNKVNYGGEEFIPQPEVVV